MPTTGQRETIRHASPVALDPGRGTVWGIEFEDHLAGYYLTLVLLAVNGKILIEVSDGEFDIRGFVQTFDA